MNKAFATYLASLMLFGSNGIVASRIHLPSYDIVFMRTLLGSAFLLALLLVSCRSRKPAFNARDCGFVCLSGIAMGASWMFLYEAYAQVGVGIASLLNYTGPVIVMALSPILFKERLTAAKLVGFAAVLAGVVMVNGRAEGAVNVFGVACGLLSAFTYAVMIVANKKATRMKGVENALVQMLAALVVVALFVGVRDGGFAMDIATSDWMWILVLGLVNTGVGCYWYFSSMGKLPVQTVAVCGYLEPLSAVVLAVFLLGETMSVVQIAGAILILGGALFAERFPGRTA